MDLDAENRKEVIRALLNIAALEGILLVAIVAIYLRTNNVVYLAGGIIASTLIFGPMFFRWFKAHGKALKVQKNDRVE